jgi:hypothetical protein
VIAIVLRGFGRAAWSSIIADVIASKATQSRLRECGRRFVRIASLSLAMTRVTSCVSRP